MRYWQWSSALSPISIKFSKVSNDKMANVVKIELYVISRNSLSSLGVHSCANKLKCCYNLRICIHDSSWKFCTTFEMLSTNQCFMHRNHWSQLRYVESRWQPTLHWKPIFQYSYIIIDTVTQHLTVLCSSGPNGTGLSVFGILNLSFSKFLLCSVLTHIAFGATSIYYSFSKLSYNVAFCKK